MSKDTQSTDPFAFIVNKQTDWNTPYKPRADVGTSRVSNLIKQPTDQIKPEPKQEKVDRRERPVQPPAALPVEQPPPQRKATEKSLEKINYQEYLGGVHKYRLKGSNKHLAMAYYTLFVKPVFEIHQKSSKNKDPAQYLKDVANAYGTDVSRCASMFETLNRWLYSPNSLTKTSESILFRSSEPFLKNIEQRGQSDYPYSQQPMYPPKEQFNGISGLPKDLTSALDASSKKQTTIQPIPRYPAAFPFGYDKNPRYPPARQFDDYYEQSRFDPMFDPRFDGRFDRNYDARYDRQFDARFDPRLEPRGYDRYDSRGYDRVQDRYSPRPDPRTDPRIPFDPRGERLERGIQQLDRPTERPLERSAQIDRPPMERPLDRPFIDNRPPQPDRPSLDRTPNDVRQPIDSRQPLDSRTPLDSRQPPIDPRQPIDSRPPPIDTRPPPMDTRQQETKPEKPMERPLPSDARDQRGSLDRARPPLTDARPPPIQDPRPQSIDRRDPRDPALLDRGYDRGYDPRYRDYDMGRYMPPRDQRIPFGKDMYQEPRYPPIDSRYPMDRYPPPYDRDFQPDPRLPIEGRDSRDPRVLDPRDQRNMPDPRDPRMMDRTPIQRPPMERDPRIPMDARERSDRIDRSERSGVERKRNNFAPPPYK
ncbi:hypothetical protein EIN_222310 [Entamoeba invadens IP1]|uniref:Uncharacterized protein n=1 Tax=Entamoeba invadens IP1 TaxID=370355 RepID=A0A0A1U7Z8_ENTIV|nr:hypothetical protein EIN_222310 [Entamoeba invadens IP1]ELP88088.1 hypothetical protein EIN_222310 [Entamoeba invadens IP1]|eukprot:XP_004254859.1 hypothetical protein EIN_222310 [Entamoeba invadens IP1]